jgi:hypothetical protein
MRMRERERDQKPILEIYCSQMSSLSTKVVKELTTWECMERIEDLRLYWDLKADKSW